MFDAAFYVEVFFARDGYVLYPLPCVEQERLLFPVVAGEDGGHAYDVPAAGLVERYYVAEGELHDYAAAGYPDAGGGAAFEREWVLESGGVGVSGGEAEHVKEPPRFLTDTVTLLRRVWTRREQWIIAPESVIVELSRVRAIFVSELRNPPPDRVCYRIRHRSPKLGNRDAVGLFNGLLDGFVKEMHREIPVGVAWGKTARQ